MNCLYGTESDNVCAYCRRHQKGLTVRQVRKKECLKKQCYYLVKYENHSWWQQRQNIKAKRKANKIIY